MNGEHPLAIHLQNLEQAVREWLEANYYASAPSEKRRAMRKAALLPLNQDAEMPEPYRLWRMCQTHLWWPGGIADQPHLLMLEFAVCDSMHQQFQGELANMEKIIGGN